MICSWVLLYFFNICSQSCPPLKLMPMAATLTKNYPMGLLWVLIQDNFKK